jgi:hypothetical protein
MDPIKITLEFLRSSKNYHVYAVQGGALVPDKVYLRQTDLGPTPPLTLTLTATADAAEGTR